MHGPSPLWWLPWCYLEHIGHAYCSNQVTIFQGQSGILGSSQSHLDTLVAISYAPDVLYLLKGQLHGWYPGWDNSFLTNRGCHCLMRQDMENSEDCLKLWKANPNVPPTPHPDPNHESSAPWLPIVKIIRLISQEKHNHECRGLLARAYEWSKAKPLWAQPPGCCSSFLLETLPEEHCVYCYELLPSGLYRVLSPSRAETLTPSIASDTVPDPYCLELQTHLSQW